jgi:hypothetical protein
MTKAFTIASAVVAVCGAMLAQATFAQDAAPASRADVKAETKAAEKAGKFTPAGEGAAMSDTSTPKSTKTKADRKAEVAAARKSGELAPAGPAPDYPKTTTPSGKTRAERKAETRAAIKNHETLPAGEGQNAPAK